MITLAALARFRWSFLLTGVALVFLPSHAQAIPDPDGNEADRTTTATILPLAVHPQVGIGYDSGDNGSPSFSDLEVFYPLWQSAGQSLGYTYGQLRLGADQTWGGSVMMGYRIASPNRVWGAYLGFDQQSTGRNQFQQLGVGFESLGDWDFRLNGYLPIGPTRQLAADTGLQLKEHYFRGHDLNLVLEQQQIYEAAARGVDLEVGTRLFDWGAGEVRGYGGLYYYEPTGGEGALGYRMRVTANPVEFLNMGVTMQQDRLFGSRLSFQVGVRWGGANRSHRTPSTASLLTHFSTPPQRMNAIAIDQQTVIAQNKTVVATNPDTRQPWYFLHVKPGSGAADGQFETPFSTIEGAIAVAPSNQNTIIYVQEVSQPAGNLTIPDFVRLWSTGPTQPIDTQELGRIPLPLSNSGIYPRINGTVTMRHDTHLAGFTIQPASGRDAVIGERVRNLTIRANRITATGDNGGGIQLDDVTGRLAILENQITTTGRTTQGKTGAHGVTVNQEAAMLTMATLTGNTILTQGTRANGVYARLRNGGSGIETLTLTNNVIRTTADDGQRSNDHLVPQPLPAIAAEQAHGVFVFANANSRVGMVSLQNNQVTTRGDRSQAAFVFAQNNAMIDQLSLDRNQFTTYGYKANAISAFSSSQAQLGQVTITQNRLLTTGDESPAVLTFATGAGSQMQRSRIQENQVTTQGRNSDAVLAFASQAATLGEATITGNTVTTTNDYGSGLLAFAAKNSTLGTATITGNQIATQGAFADGLLAFASQGSTLIEATITGNTVTTRGQGGGLPVGAPTTYSPNYGYSGGIMAFASDGSTLATASIQGNRVVTQGSKSNAIAVFASSSSGSPGSSMTAVNVANNQVNTMAADSQGLMVFATNTSTLTAATVTGNTSITQGDRAAGLFAFASKSQNFGQAMITDNAIATQGQEAAGINIAANQSSQIAGVTVTGNTSQTSGQNADGIAVSASGNSTLPSVTVHNNRTTTTNDQADGIAIALQTHATLTTGTISRNTITTNGEAAQGIFTNANLSTVTGLDVTTNTVNTTGPQSNGIGFTASSSTTQQVTIAQNGVNTAGNGAIGIDVTALNGTLDTAQVQNNTVTTTGGTVTVSGNLRGAIGINFSALNMTILANAIATENTITTQQDRAIGLQVLAANGSITTATIQRNTIITAGSEAPGLSVLATASTTTGKKITTALLTHNTITTQGDNSAALSLLSSNTGEITTSTLDQNQLFTSGMGANGILALAKDATLSTLTINANTIRSQQSNGVTLQASDASTIGTAILTNSVILKAGLHSFNWVVNGSGTPNACVQTFTGNDSQNPTLRDLLATHSAGTFKVVGLGAVAANNTGFDSVSAAGTIDGTALTCP